MNGNNATANKYNLTQHTPNSIITVAVLGAESTGKTTLCRDLARHFKGSWVPEYMRSYLQEKWDTQQALCTWDDLLPIAQGQVDLENTIAKQATQNISLADQPNPRQNYLFCDTSLFELMVYARWYYNDCPASLVEAALAHHYDLILLTEVDTPWVADDLRDSPHERLKMSALFEDELNRYGKSFQRIGGTRHERVHKVRDQLNALENIT